MEIAPPEETYISPDGKVLIDLGKPLATGFENIAATGERPENAVKISVRIKGSTLPEEFLKASEWMLKHEGKWVTVLPENQKNREVSATKISSPLKLILGLKSGESLLEKVLEFLLDAF